jgi:carboxyl-terminal processing protease
MSNTSGTFKTILIASIWVFLLIPATVFASFTDVPTKHPNYKAITSLAEQKIINGYDDGTFRPSQPVTRAELLKIIFKDVGYAAKEDSINQTKYLDVPAEAWFSSYVKKAYDLGIIAINPDLPFFYPDAPITKVEALKIIMPLEGIPAPYTTGVNTTVFSDIRPDSPYAYIAVAALGSGLYTQDDGARFNPFKIVTRAEAAEFVYRSEQYRESGAQNIFVINPENTNTYLTETEAQFIDNPKFPILLDVWSKINDEYVNKNNLNTNDLIYGAIDGMVKTVDDPYTIFEKPENAQSVQDDLEGTFEGIGTIMDTLDDNFIIVTVLKDSPAEKAGLQAGDVVTAVDGKTLSELAIEEVIDLIKGAAGTTVKLTIKRGDSVLNFTITREKLNLDTVMPDPSYVTKIPEDIGYISIYQFTGSTSDEFTDLFKKTLDANPKGLILDLRDNPGGYLDSAYSVLGHFIPKGGTIMNLKIDGQTRPQASQGEGEFQDKKIPMIVLVNDGSASAAEVVAGALQDYGLGKLLGVQSYGKGTVQEVTTYVDGSFFKISIAHWLTPLKHDINKIGLTPDITVERTKTDLLNQSDSQLERAIQELQK